MLAEEEWRYAAVLVDGQRKTLGVGRCRFPAAAVGPFLRVTEARVLWAVAGVMCALVSVASPASRVEAAAFARFF